MRQFFLLVCLLASSATVSAAELDFARDVLPVLQRACFECHGPVKQQGGLRLDTPEALQQGGDSGAAVVAKQPQTSELLRRISLPAGDDEIMPSRGEPLTRVEISHIRDWIAAGAVWPAGVRPARHWAYVVPRQRPLPNTSTHPVDAFVRERLREQSLPPARHADFATLARRLFLDVVGLPPTPAQVRRFEQQAQSNLAAAVEAQVDELLASPQYGEKWARPWLDAARYADSHGFQRDDLRDLWPYRDWVIRALNADMPFDQFTIEQLAGDLLPNATESLLIATGFNRSAPCNVEAGTDPEENRVNQIFDRVNTLGAVWLGTSLECAQCHDHKYDPFTMRDYYGLFAFFNQTEIEAERSNPKVPGSIRFLGPYLDLKAPEEERERRQLTAKLAALKARKADAATRSSTPVTSDNAASEEHVLKPIDFDSDGDAGHRVLDDQSILLVGDPPATDIYTVVTESVLPKITGFKLEALTDPSLPGGGPGRGDPDRTNFVLHEFQVEVAPLDRPTESRSMKLKAARASFSQTKFDVAGAIDGDEQTAWAIAPRFKQSHWASFELAKPLAAAKGVRLTFRLVQKYGSARTIGRFRLSALTGNATPPEAKPSVDSELDQEIAQVEQALNGLKPQRSLVMKEQSESRPSTMFQRGDFRSPGAQIEPTVPAFLTEPAVTKDATSTTTPSQASPVRNRLDLARWLVQRDNPLTARVVVNRLWLEIFGDGLVRTPEDFGLKGERPSHPELLDWLAVEFMERGWSQKQLLKLILTSETYRQDSALTPAQIATDPQNRWLARGPRFRLGGEAIRDNALAISGLLNLKQFGPPIRPPQPEGLWNKVGGERYDYIVSPGAEQHRRGLYVVLKRMSPYPSLITFDATARLSCRVKRLRSNTPLQALTLLNDPVYVQAAEAFAARIVKDLPEADTDKQLQHAFQLAVARTPTTKELEILSRLYASELAATNTQSAWLAVASALLNLDETITKN